MAQIYVKASLGMQPKDFTTGTGAPAIASGDVALTFDPALPIRRGDMEVIIERLRQYIISHNFPPA
ncbi:hypothetical protein [Novosphingobium rosa]|uniref:hypothetical protein n=1 Tax=Novosphingobium rosa TaxID=76978 RepID=UPI00082A2EAA|nr:hypothetical protein [Novosphingobium rosa]